MPNETARAAIHDFWQREGSAYDTRSEHGIFSASERRLWTAELATIPDSGRVLDIGTGTGFVALLAAELGHQVTGIDPAPTMLAAARARAANQGVNVTFKEGVTERLPFDDASFDAVTARHVIWTLLEPAQAFAEWHRILIPGGKLLADCTLDPHVASYHYTDDVAAALPLQGITDPSPVVHALSAAGFTELETNAAPAESPRAMLRARVGANPGQQHPN